MSGIVRDFSLSSVEHLKGIIKQNVDEDGELFLVDWVKDWFIDDLDIHDYINDIDTYHAKMVDKYDISTKKFDEILNKVHAVDVSYADRFNNVYEGLSSFNALIMNVTALINPSAVTLDSNAYDELLGGIENIHAEKMQQVKDYIKYDDQELDDALREIPWYETALDFVAGAGVELVKNNLEGIAFIPYSIIDGIFGTDFNDRLSNNLDYLEETYVLPHIGNNQAYYYGKAAGDIITMVEGIYGMAKGLFTLMSGLGLVGGGAVLEASGVGAIFGAAAQAISIPLVIAGTAEFSFALAIAGEGYSNFEDNIKIASTDKVSEITGRQGSLDNNLKDINAKSKVVIPKQVERVAKKLSPEAKKGYEKAIEALMNGDTRGLNEHPLSGNRSGQWAVDIKGMGRGRGAGRIIYIKNSDGTINIIEILTKHDY